MVIFWITVLPGRIVWAWVLTIPAAAVIAGLTYGVVLIFEKLTGRI